MTAFAFLYYIIIKKHVSWNQNAVPECDLAMQIEGTREFVIERLLRIEGFGNDVFCYSNSSSFNVGETSLRLSS